MKTIVSVASARPNFVKLAAMHHALSAHPDTFEHIIVHTGQHYDPLLSDIFFEQLAIPDPDLNLGIHGTNRSEVIQATADAMAKVLPEIKPDIVLVYGDVNGAVGAARAASILGFPIGHVEAGLRSGDLDMPEELNRVEIDALADYLFCSEQSGIDHLEAEKNRGKRFLVGNTMIDTLVRLQPVIDELTPVMQQKMRQFPEGTFAIATLHRPSNVDNPVILQRVMQFLEEVAKHCPVMLAAHPRLAVALKVSMFQEPPTIPLFITPPMGYLEFLGWMKHAAFVMTDSGGIQEEAMFLKKRCFTLRKNTERPSTIDAGSNILIDSNKEEDRNRVLAFAAYPLSPEVRVPELWDGKAGERISAILHDL
jgi:UDP-N-acetylglucosamine 2-epimerase (non-hydrolysing)